MNYYDNLMLEYYRVLNNAWKTEIRDACQRNFNMHQFWHFKVHHLPSQLKFSDGALERSRKAPSENFSLALRVSNLSFRR